MPNSNSWKLRALMKKNYLILKRNIVSTLFEILFPIILILLAYAIRKAFVLEIHEFSKQEESLEKYIKTKSVVNFNRNNLPEQENTIEYEGLSVLPALEICNKTRQVPRLMIATIGIPEEIKNRIIDDANHPNVNSNFRLTLSSSNFVLTEGIHDIPHAKNGIFDRFQTGPDLESYEMYQKSGYTYILKIMNEYILRKELDNNNAEINFAIVPMKYSDYKTDPFSKAIGYMIPFFLIIEWSVKKKISQKKV